MLKINKFFLLYTSLAICILMQTPGFIPQLYAIQDYFTQGKELRKSGDWEGALKVWGSARNELDLQGKVDPSIGIAFIELAIEVKASEYYGAASELYLWGFSKMPSNEFQTVFEEEIDRVLPLVDKNEQGVWRKALDQQDEDICQYLQLFWLEKDSRPSTPVNERLIEHWQRIVHSRKNFVKNHQSVYDCDARGTIYVKYGKPDRKQNGRLGLAGPAVLELLRWVPNHWDRNIIKFEDLNPEYEIWKYYNLGTQQPNVFLFAYHLGNGSFRLVDGVESLIPSRKSIYQLMYYAELSQFDRLFHNRYLDLERIKLNLQLGMNRGQLEPYAKGNFLGLYNTNRISDKVNVNNRSANLDRSTFEELFGKIDIITHDIRLLDQNNQPILAIVSFSYPTFKAREVKSKSNISTVITDYQIKQTLIIRDESLEEIDRLENLVPEGMGNVDVFWVKHVKKNNHFTVSSEAFANYIDTTPIGNLSSEEQFRLLAFGKTFFAGSEPLTANLDSLELSDWVVGVKLPSENYNYLPFPLVPAQKVSKRDPLQVYCEIYHLRKDAGGTAHYTLEFGIIKLDKKGRLDKKAKKVSVVYNFDVPDQTRKEHIGIDITELKPGLYEFFGKVTDKVSGQEKSRKKKITILK